MTFDPWVAVALGVAALIALLLPVAVAVALRRRTGASWRAFFIGAAIFLVFQIVLRLPWQIAIGVWLQKHHAADAVWMNGWLAVSALTAALFEELGRYFVFRRFVAEKSARSAAMLGAGHGGLESILLVGVSLVGALVTYVLFTHGLLPVPAEQLAKVTEQLSALTPAKALAGGVERIFALAAQIGFALLVMRAVAEKARGPLLLALGTHFLLDLVAGGMAQHAPLWATEAVLAIGASAVLTLGLRSWRPLTER